MALRFRTSTHSPCRIFHGSFGSNAEQISNELRYNGIDRR